MWIPVDIEYDKDTDRISRIYVVSNEEYINKEEQFINDTNGLLYKYYQSDDLLHNREHWERKDLLRLADKNLKDDVMILVSEHEDYYLCRRPGIRGRYHKVYKECDCNITIPDLINGDISFKENKLKITGKYTDLTKTYLENRAKLEYYRLTLLPKYNIFGLPYNIFDEDSIIVAYMGKEELKTDLKRITFNTGIEHIIINNSSNNKSIEELVLPSTTKYVRIHRISFMEHLKKVTFSEGIEKLDLRCVQMYEFNNIDVYLPKSLKYIDNSCLDAFRQSHIFMYEDTIKSMGEMDKVSTEMLMSSIKEQLDNKGGFYITFLNKGELDLSEYII